MNPEQEAAATRRVMKHYERLHKDLVQLVEALQKTEPTGNFVDKGTFKTKNHGTVQVSYRVRPTQLIIEANGRRFKLRLEELHNSGGFSQSTLN